MQVFLPFPSPIQTAGQLDKRRLHNQINEAAQILRAIDGTGRGWQNHPATRTYKPHRRWLELYRNCLIAFQAGDIESATALSNQADAIRPSFVTDDFCLQHRRRLYTKSPELYPQFAHLGTSLENWYVVDGQMWRYIGGKRI